MNSILIWRRVATSGFNAVGILSAVLLLSSMAWCQEARPLKVEDLEQLLNGGVTQERIIHLIRAGGVVFEMTPALKARLTKAGAEAGVMQAAESAAAEYSKKSQQAARRREEEAKRKQQEAKQKDIEAAKAEAAKRKAEDEQKRSAEEQRRKAIEAENRRVAAERKKQQEEALRLAALNKLKAADEAKRRDEETRLKKAAEDETRRSEKARKQMENDRRIEEARQRESMDPKNAIALAPSCNVGASWTFRYDDGTRFVRRIISRTGDLCNVGKSFFDNDWVLVKQLGPNNAEISAPTVDFPLIGKQWMPFPIRVGSEWRVEFRTKPAGGRNVSFYSDNFSVVGFEKVEVPAGSFMAFKIKVDRRTQGLWAIRYLWYAPQVEYYVKFRVAPEESHQAYETTFKNYELVSFNRAGAKTK